MANPIEKISGEPLSFFEETVSIFFVLLNLFFECFFEKAKIKQLIINKIHTR